MAWMVPLFLGLGAVALLMMAWVLLEQRFQKRLQQALKQQRRDLQTEFDRLQAEKDALNAEREALTQLTPEAARQEILDHWHQQLSEEKARQLEHYERELDRTKTELSAKLLSRTLQSQAASHVREATRTDMQLPDEKLKGRVIGKGGKNLQAFQHVTGVDLMVSTEGLDLTLTAFDPLKRELARRTLKTLLVDGRIYPERIAEVYRECQRALEKELPELARAAVAAAGVTTPLPKKLLPVLGQLHYRTSVGQNLLKHAQEVAQLAGILAQDIGADEVLARRGGLLHDIGKAIPETPDSGTHSQRGVALLQTCGESKAVQHIVAAHHRETPPQTPEAFLVQAADALSAARPGARSEKSGAQIQRAKAIEAFLKTFPEVENVVVLKAGHEAHIMIDPDECTEAETRLLGHQIAKALREKYPDFRMRVAMIREWKGSHYV